MSRTIRKSKTGVKYPDGKKEKKAYYCNCWFCTGNNKQDLYDKQEKCVKKEIKEEFDYSL